MSYELVVLSDPSDWADFHRIRRVELFEAKGRFGIYDPNHPDDVADFATPFLLKKDGVAIGTTRLDMLGDGRAAFRLVAITRAEQGRGHGRVMDGLVTAEARKRGVHTLLVNAAPEAVGYYQKTGWAPFKWDPNELVGIAETCVQMRKLI